MEILGIGPLELLFILLIALIVLGPGDMVKAGRTLGRFMHRIVTSSEWRMVQKASRELRYLPNRLMREASLEDISKDLTDMNKIGGQIGADIKSIEADISSWTTPPGLADDLADQPPSPAPATPPEPAPNPGDVPKPGESSTPSSIPGESPDQTESSS